MSGQSRTQSLGWTHCGEGFSGLERLGRILEDVKGNLRGKYNHIRNDENLRDSKTYSKKNKKHKNLEESATGNYAASESVDDNINWSSSSSDESACKSEFDETGSRPRHQQHLRKRQRISYTYTNHVYYKETSNLSSDTIATSEMSCSNLPKTKCDNKTVLHSMPSFDDGEKQNVTKSAVCTAHVAPVSFSQSYTGVQKATWPVSSFDQPLGNRIASSKYRDTNKGHETCLKATRKRSVAGVVKQLGPGGSLDICEQISDVESETSEKEQDVNEDIVDEDAVSDTATSPSVNIRDTASESDWASQPQQGDSTAECSQVAIDSNDSPGSCATSQKIKATEWVVALQKQKTPVKGEHCVISQQDSGKKNRKYERGSLADQLSRLILREKAAVRFWYHVSDSEEKSQKSIKVKLLTLEKSYTLHLAQCRLLDISTTPGRSDLCRVLFTIEAVQRHSLRPGMSVRIHAPWQELEEPGGVKTILCAHYLTLEPDFCRKVTEEVSENSRHKLDVSARWVCPCSADPKLPTKDCPAALYPMIPSQSVLMNHVQASSLSMSTLHAVTASQSSAETGTHKRTLLESLELMKGDNFPLPCFVAVVLRVFRHRVKGTLSQRLLVEDLAGTLALVRLPDQDSGQVSPTEGTTCSFSSLQVVLRTNRDRDPSLFKIIDQVWMQHAVSASSQLSGSDTSQIQQNTSAPSFAYMLQATASLNSVLPINLPGLAREVPIRCMSAGLAAQIKEEARVSLMAKVLVPTRCYQGSRRGHSDQEAESIFVYDESLDEAGYTVTHAMEIDRKCVMGGAACDEVYLFRDVLAEAGRLRCDSWTLVLEMSSWNQWGVTDRLDQTLVSQVKGCSLRLPPLSDTCRQGSLVYVEGHISGVDESLSYSWEQCDKCGCHRLASSEQSGIIYCTDCETQVNVPLIRMKMQVFVCCQHLQQDRLIKVDLTQKTIELLLPTDTQEEGYDVDQVMGKPVHCPACLLYQVDQTSNTRPCWTLHELQAG